jgi:hypothetical protein
MPLRVLIILCLLSGTSLSAQDMGVASATIEAQATVVPSMGFTTDRSRPSHADLLAWGRKSSNLQISIERGPLAHEPREPIYLASLFVPGATFTDPGVRQELSRFEGGSLSTVVVTIVDTAD